MTDRAYRVEEAEAKNTMTVGDLVQSAPTASPDTRVSSIKEEICGKEPLSAVVIVASRRPVGLVMRLHIDQTLSHTFGVSLYYKKPVSALMDATPMVVDAATPVAGAADLAMGRERRKIFDHLIVTRDGKLAGIVSVQDILDTLVRIQEKNSTILNRVNRRLQTEIDERRRAEDELMTLNQELGQRVADRTAALEASNIKLKAAADAARAANRAKSDFIANMSHELRTPLNHIIGFTELLIEQHFGSINEMQSEYLNDVLGSGRHLLSLINDILDLSKVEAGKLELRAAPVELSAVLENSLRMFKEKALKHGIRLATEVGDLPEAVEADERKLKQVLFNLLSNAFKFTPDGGQVTLAARQRATPCTDGLATEEAADSPPWLEIEIRDTGIGLSPTDIERIFEPFEQVESSRSRRFQGTGLGLSLTRRLVSLHGGRIEAESPGENQGATFRVAIPSRQPQPSLSRVA